MAILALTSLLASIEHISSSPYQSCLSPQQILDLRHLKHRLTFLLIALKRLGNKFNDYEPVRITNERIRDTAPELEYSFLAAAIDALPHQDIYKRLRQIATWADSLKYHLWIHFPKLKAWELISEDNSNFPTYERTSATDSSSSELDTDNKVNLLSVGLEESLRQLRQELTGSSRKLAMVGIVGMAGIGKTTLAKLIFQDPSIIERFHLLAWVKVSQIHSKSDMLIQVLKCISSQRDYDIHAQTEAFLEEDLYRNLKGQRYLIVVDDLWSVQAWTEIRRPYSDDCMGSRILFTSRQSKVIEDLKCKKIHQMSLLDEETSWELLQTKVFGQATCPPDLIDTGKLIAKKCQGLPLAIVVIAGILLKLSKKSESWKVIAESITSLVLSSTNPCHQTFALSYNHLPAHLKSCFLYMGAFPGGGFEIESRGLARLWIAEGFVTPRETHNLEQVADEYLKDLIDRSLILIATKRSNGKVKTCRMHDLLLEFCINQAREEKFLYVIPEEEGLEGKETENYEKENNGEVPQKNQKEKIYGPSRFSFHCNTSENIPPKSRAHTALFRVSSREVPDILLYNLDFKLIGVLDMTPLRFDSFPEDQVSRLLLLKYLALTASFEVPSVVFNLLKLQTLIVYDSRIKSDTTTALALPREFWGSINLRHMQLQVANYLPPPDDELMVKQLASLRILLKVTLATFFTLDFACIPNLAKLGVCETMDDFCAYELWNKFFEKLALLSHLETLKVYCLQMNNRCPRVLPIPSPNMLPENLRKLTLSRSHLPWEKMKILGELPNLEVLKLRNYAFQGPEWETEVEGFQRLSYLLIENTNLKHWSLECADCFPRLNS